MRRASGLLLAVVLAGGTLSARAAPMTWPGASPRPSASRPSCATASRTCKRHRHARGRPQGSGRRAETVRIFHFPHQSAAARAGRGQSPGPGRPGQPGKADRRPARRRWPSAASSWPTSCAPSTPAVCRPGRRCCPATIRNCWAAIWATWITCPRPAPRRCRRCAPTSTGWPRCRARPTPVAPRSKSGGRDHRAEDRPGRPAERALHAAGPVGRADRRPARRGQQAGPGRPAPVAPDHRPGRGHRQAGRGSPSRGRGAQEGRGSAPRRRGAPGRGSAQEGRGRASRRGSPQESRRSAPRRGRASRCRRRAPQPRCAGCAGRGRRASRSRPPPASSADRSPWPTRTPPACVRPIASRIPA